MQALETRLLEEVGADDPDKRTVPGVAIAAGTKDGRFKYAKAFGKRSIQADADAWTMDTTLWIASCTKLMTTIAVMQCVERGLITLDEDISRVLPEWKDPEILVGFNDAGEPILKKAKNKLTLRILLTHTSGMTYETVDPDLLRYKEYQKSKGRDTAGKGSTVAELYFNPLVFEPGEQWKYGRSIDWAGLVVERVNGGMSLGAYMEEKIWKPLGMTATTFDPLSHPHVMQNLASMTVRLDDEGLVPAETTYWAGMGAPEKSPVEGGGGSLYSSTADYLKLLTAILRNDGVLLKEETMREIFEPQIDPAILQHALNVVDPAMRKVMGIPEDRAVSWALGGLVSLEDVPGGQRKGTISWAGMPSCFWWIDPQTELYGFYASQVLPTGDPPSVELNREFEKAVYQQVMA